jgi:KDO transferase-3
MKQMSFKGEYGENTEHTLHNPESAPTPSNQRKLTVYDFGNCRNIASGAVFILASGLSAKSFPIEKFAHVPMITMNGAISMFLNTDIKPFFYVCSDRVFSEQQPYLFKNAMTISQRVALWEEHARTCGSYPSGQLYGLSKAKKPSWLQSVLGRHTPQVTHHLLRGRGKRNIGFSKDMREGFFDARTVAYLAIQLAFHVGFSKVFLVGVDLNQNSGRFYENRESINSPCGLDQHYYTRILPSLELMSQKIVGDDFKVYNLSDCSRIPERVIPRVTLAQAQALIQG